MDKLDYKKINRDLYLPKTKPMIIDVPEMTFIMVDGKGNPNTCEEYKIAMQILYGLSWGIKMSKMGTARPEGYFEYVMPPLEGLWWNEGEPFDGITVKDKNKFLWTSMIRQPEFVTQAVFEQAKVNLHKKNPELDLNKARLIQYTEGLCAHIMHIGSYDDEPETIQKLNEFIEASGYLGDMSDKRRHHEIYLSDPRKTAPERRKTVIRHPIRKR